MKSIWWGLCCVFWYWRNGVPMIAKHNSAWWHGFYLRKLYNDPANQMDNPDEPDSPSYAVECDMDYWEE